MPSPEPGEAAHEGRGVLKAGHRIGDWIIDRHLGEGGMGAVFRVHSALSERVEAALKVMKPSLEPDARARFVREAEALSALRHPAIIRVMGFNEDPTRGLLYMVMELAHGETLKRRLERGPLGLAEVLGIFVPLAAGLEHAHQSGIFHRDLKPSNVVLTEEGPRLVDFGIATATAADTLTGGGHLGTLSYLPPEVFRGEKAEPRDIDVYAFGLLLDEALTGVHPFPVEGGMTPAAAAAIVGMRKVQAPPHDPGEGVPESIRDLIRRATDPDPRRRPEMAEIRKVLSSLVERRAAAPAAAPTSGPPRMPAWMPPPDHTTRVPDPVIPAGLGTGSHTTSRVKRRLFRERRRSVIYAWVASMLAAALVAAILILLVNGSAVAPIAPSPAPGETPASASRQPAFTPPAAAAAPAVIPSPAGAVPALAPPAMPSPAVEATPAPSPTPPLRSFTPSSPRPSPAPSPRPAATPEAPAPAPPEQPSPEAPEPTLATPPPAEEEPSPPPPSPSPPPPFDLG